ncbi:MAG TPA: hypothetical protein VK668_19805 [Mucilaginibacter sp.]|nr:hypothetical protein [Mucilaginibacter sp.]
MDNLTGGVRAGIAGIPLKLKGNALSAGYNGKIHIALLATHLQHIACGIQPA